ncbi:MAG: type IV secretion system DNA-binding domain-containing protein [Brasilonema angustatum HA4187-MV1]|jgi:type IV secretory pathway TraG/TraD family ATPase VirD4|nr:type IV secretion system DNA-binding domain-containing protein [Brasilonema angustatum HA4187-MV1]
MSIRILKRHIAELQDNLKAHTKNFWANFGLLIFALFMWSNILPVLIVFQPYFRTDKWEDFAVWGIFLLVFMLILATLGVHGEGFKPTAWDWGIIVLFLLWLGFCGLVRSADPTDAPAKNLEEAVLYATLWTYKTTIVWISSLWLLGIFWHRLYFTHQNQNRKLNYFYIIFGISLAIITTAYLMFAPLGFIVSLILPQKMLGDWLESRTKKPFTERGTVIEGINNGQNQRETQRESEQSLRRAPDLRVEFGGNRIPMRQMVMGGMLFMGAVGSGKSLSIQLVMQDCLPHVYLGSQKRAIVLNASRDAISKITAISSGRLCIVDPTDARCCRVDFSKSITSDGDVENFVQIVFSPIAENQHGEKFFRDAAIQIFTGITLYLIKHAPRNWQLRDILLIAESQQRLRAILSSDPDTAHYLDVMATEKTADNVHASVKVELNKYRVLAALFYHATDEITIDEWMQGGCILVLGHDHRFAPLMSVLNRLVLKHAVDEILATDPETRDARTFFFLDECQLNPMDILRNLLLQGRKRGAAVVLGTQSINAMYQETGKQNTEIIFGMIDHLCGMRVNETDTAEWLSQKMGQAIFNQLTNSYEYVPDFGKFIGHINPQGAVENRTTVPAVMASEFMTLPRIDPPRGQGMTAYYKTTQPWKNYYPWDELKQKLVPPSSEPDYIPVEEAKMRLPQWTEDDWRRLNIYDVMKGLEKQENQKQSGIKAEENISNEASSSEFDPDAVNRRLIDLREMLRQAQNNSDDDDTIFTGNNTAQEQQPTIYRQMNLEALKRRQIKKNPKQQLKNQKPNQEKGFNR